MFKKFFIWLIKSLIILLIVTFIFSTITLDFPNLLKGLFGDIFAYASPDAQKQVVSKLAESCSSLDQGQSLLTIAQICTNRSLLDSMRENCQNYGELKDRDVKIEDEAKVIETCQQIESGEIERACNQLKEKSSLVPDFSKIGALCKDYKAGKINDKEFFFGVIGSSFGGQQIEMPKIGGLEKYNKMIAYLNNNKLLYFVILSILIILLYLFIRNVTLFLPVLSGICFSIGILIMVPYLAILAYDKFVGIDTTPILNIMFGTGGFEPKAIISVILLMFLRTYTSFIITLGIVFLAVGIIGKVYAFILKRKNKRVEPKKKGKVKELLDELEESAKKKGKS